MSIAVEEMVIGTIENANTGHVTDVKVNGNGSTVFRITSFLGMLCNISCMMCVGFMAGLQGQDGSNLKNSYSPTLVTLSCFSVFGFFYSGWDLKKIWKPTKDSIHAFTWAWQHENVMRALPPFAFHSLVIWPTVLTFVIQSRGSSFFGHVNRAKGELEDVYVTILITFPLLVISCILNMYTVKKVLDSGHFGADGRHEASHAESSAHSDAPNLSLRRQRKCPVWDIVGKLSALSSIALSVTYCYVVILSCGQGENTGLYVSAVLYTLVTLFTTLFNLQILIRLRGRKKKWWLSYRAVVALNLFVGYVSFWVVLMIVSLLTSGTKGGFFRALDKDITDLRQSLVYTYMGTYIVYLAMIVWRVYYAKLRKEGRQERILDAQYVSPALERLLSFSIGADSSPTDIPDVKESKAEETKSTEVVQVGETAVLTIHAAPTSEEAVEMVQVFQPNQVQEETKSESA